MKQKLFAIVSNEDGRIMSNSKGKLGIFTKAGTARQHAWRYGAKEGNHEIVEYQPVRKSQTIDEIMDDVLTGSYMGQS